MVIQENVQNVAKEARQSISSYCMTECNAYCCRKGFLVVSEDELNLLTGDKRKELEEKEFIKKQDDGLFSLNLGNNLGSCPSLSGSKCTVHKNPKRPSTCDKYPIFINEDTKEIRLSPRCFAVKENKLYLYVHKFKQMGFKVNDV